MSDQENSATPRDRAERFVSDGGGIVATQCLACRHLHAGDAFSCDAFPASIPAEIVANLFDHRSPHDGDGGIGFEARPGVPDDYLRRLGETLDGLSPED